MAFNPQINQLLLSWYRNNRRELPWRKDKNPYHVWVSEIMLQQTRIEAVIPYYERFMNRIPDIAALANISEDELLKVWEGLGYYSRARNLKKAAQKIVSDFDGIFPTRYEDMLKLPGIGEYTASAIASICFNEATVTIDGNVLRVYTRICEDKRNVDLNGTKKQIREEIKEFMPLEAGEFNEALMELGEVICLPNGKPKCNECPLNSICLANRHQTWQYLPVKLEKKTKKEFFYTVFLFSYHHQYAIRKRNKGLLKNLWEFPNIEGKMDLQDVDHFLKDQNIEFDNIQQSISYKHVFTHQVWYMQAYEIQVSKELNDFLWVTIMDLEKNYAIPGAFQPFLEEIKHKMK